MWICFMRGASSKTLHENWRRWEWNPNYATGYGFDLAVDMNLKAAHPISSRLNYRCCMAVLLGGCTKNARAYNRG